MEVEMRSLQDHQVWNLVKLPPGKKTVGSKWVLEVKTNQERELERFKARLVTQSFSHLAGDFNQTFCPVVRQAGIITGHCSGEGDGTTPRRCDYCLPEWQPE